MDRHKDWAVIFCCFVGGGQEINTGEAGIGEWVSSITRSFPDWRVYVSSRLTDSEYQAGAALKQLESHANVSYLDELHFGVFAVIPGRGCITVGKAVMRRGLGLEAGHRVGGGRGIPLFARRIGVRGFPHRRVHTGGRVASVGRTRSHPGGDLCRIGRILEEAPQAVDLGWGHCEAARVMLVGCVGARVPERAPFGPRVVQEIRLSPALRARRGRPAIFVHGHDVLHPARFRPARDRASVDGADHRPRHDDCPLLRPGIGQHPPRPPNPETRSPDERHPHGSPTC